MDAPRSSRLFTETLVADERQTNSPAQDPARVRPEYTIVSCDSGDPRREEAEAFIRKRFLRSHGARIVTFMPSLQLLTDSHGELAAVAGYRRAVDAPLFLERYLPVPVEQALASHVASRVARAEIVEIGNFAAVDSRRAKILMSFMPAWFLERSARWIVFTATSAIRGILSAMGGRCIEIGAADGACVASGMDEWGRYYSTDPRVMAGFLPSARRIPALWRSQHAD
jgi:hypothetical protein